MRFPNRPLARRDASLVTSFHVERRDEERRDASSFLVSFWHLDA